MSKQVTKVAEKDVKFIKKVVTSESIVDSPTVPKPPELTVHDIKSIEQIINVATTRGAFQASELSQVGQIYDRITTFLSWWTAKIEAETKEQTK